MVIWLLRHPTSKWNIRKIHQGQYLYEPGLSIEGLAQAYRIASFVRNVRVIGIWTSPLPRAKQLADIIKNYGYPWAPVFEKPGLAEITNGIVDGLPETEIIKKFPDGWKKFQEHALNEPCFPGGESLREAAKRGVETLTTIARRAALMPRQQYDVVLAISHGALNSLVLAVCAGFPLESSFGISQRNGCINFLRWDKERMIVDHMDFTGHLGIANFTPKIEL